MTSPNRAPPAILIALLAAGASSRMGDRDKLLEPIHGVPILRVLAERALATGVPVAVTLPPDGPRWAALEGLALRTVAVPDASTGMSASLRAIGAVHQGAAVMVLLADMPEIQTGDLVWMIDAWKTAPDRVVRATAQDGTPGQPVIFPARLIQRFRELTGDRGARPLLKGEDPLLVPLPDRRALLDLDTPDAWDSWRACTGITR